MNPDQTAPKMAGLYCYHSTYADKRADDNCHEWQEKGLYRLAPVLKTIFINVSYYILVASLTLVALF